MAAMESMAQQCATFIDKTPTPFHLCAEASRELLENGTPPCAPRLALACAAAKRCPPFRRFHGA
jgi:hypothetical protein